LLFEIIFEVFIKRGGKNNHFTFPKELFEKKYIFLHNAF